MRASPVEMRRSDGALSLFAGQNVIGKGALLHAYGGRIAPGCTRVLMRRGFDAIGDRWKSRGPSFNLAVPTIPYHGRAAWVDNHTVTRRSRRATAPLPVVPEHADHRPFCSANGHIREQQQNDEILRFVAFWKKRTGRLPEEVVFDSKLTTYPNLDRLNRMGVNFITLRRRSNRILREIHLRPPSAWRRIELEGIARIYRTPRVLDELITLNAYDGPIRQPTITDVGHEEPTLLLTNQLRRSPAKLIERYPERMSIVNRIADGIDLFHMDALSSAVAMKGNSDLQTTPTASSLYRLLGARIGQGYERAASRHSVRDFVDATATVSIDEKQIAVQFPKRAQNPLLVAAGFDKSDSRVPWLGGRHLTLTFG